MAIAGDLRVALYYLRVRGVLVKGVDSVQLAKNSGMQKLKGKNYTR